MPRMIFLNLPVKDLDKSKAFFTALGFSINLAFSDANGACVVIEKDAIHVMLLTHAKFMEFSPLPISDARKQAQVLLTLSCSSRAEVEVDELVKKAVANGGNTVDEARDLGFMYDHGFQDLDGNCWGVFWMNPAAVPPQA